MKQLILVFLSIILFNSCVVYDETPIIYHRQIPNVVYYQKYPYYYYHTPKYNPKPQPKRYNRPSDRHNVERPKRK